ncbi:MAG: hypothetical protein WB562_00965 [Candidatus Sulfotelmatobacter sp.]
MLRIPLSELTTARVRCLKCGKGVIEVSIERLDTALLKGECRFCKTEFFTPTDTDPLNALRLALAEVNRLGEVLQVEFEIASPD